MKEEKINQFDNEWEIAREMMKQGASTFDGKLYHIREDNLRLLALGFYMFGKRNKLEDIIEEINPSRK